jgi:hypothetical protein
LAGWSGKGEEVGEPGLRVDVVEPAGLHPGEAIALPTSDLRDRPASSSSARGSARPSRIAGRAAAGWALTSR